MTYNGIKKLRISLKAFKLYSILLCILITSLTYGQQASVNHLLASNFYADDNIVEITTPADWVGHQVLIGWKNKDQQTFAQMFYISNGTSAINLNKLKEWTGYIEVIATNDNRLSAKVLPKSVSHEISFFLSPNNITPGTINFDLGYKLGPIKFSYLLLSLLPIIALLFFLIGKKSTYTSLLLGFIAVWFILDLRQIKNHVDQISTFQENNNQLTPFEGFEQFYDQCENIIGEEVWRLQPISGVWNSYAKYRLANKSYAPVNKKTGRKPIYLVTSKPGNRSPLATNQGVSLVNLK